MTEKRFRMETISGMMLPFIVDNSTAKKKSDIMTTYHTYETHRKEKCLELVDLLNDFSKENEQLKQSNQRLNDELQETMGYLALKSGVEKENEQLKEQNRQLRLENGKLTHDLFWVNKKIKEELGYND